MALFVDPDDSLLDAVVRDVAPDIIQLHGSETPDRVAAIRERTKTAIMKAIKVATADDVSQARHYRDCADMILFDAKALPGATSSLPGGNGETFDWRLLDGHDGGQTWMLSGGLNVGNLSDAILKTGAVSIDASSGVERTKGEKDVAPIDAFVRAAKAVCVPDPVQKISSGVLTNV